MMEVLQSPEFLIIAMVASVIATYLPPVVIVAAIFWTNKMTSNRLADTNERIDKLRSDMNRGFEELRSQINHGDAALLAEIKTVHESLSAHITGTTSHRS